MTIFLLFRESLPDILKNEVHYQYNFGMVSFVCLDALSAAVAVMNIGSRRLANDLNKAFNSRAKALGYIAGSRQLCSAGIYPCRSKLKVSL